MVLLLAGFTGSFQKDDWLQSRESGFDFYYKQADAAQSRQYAGMINTGMQSVHGFFGKNYLQPFDVYLHPDRASLDSCWQHDWQMPSFKSECWMVASGVAKRIDWLSPRRWSAEACEHNPADTISMQQVVTHELVHVFHGQMNASPDFSNTQNMDWFVEGLATFASGQCDEGKIQQVADAIRTGNIPDSLSKFWTGKLRYALSGSMVKYIDAHYGRKFIISLLALNNNHDVLQVLGVSEKTLLADWKEYIINQTAGH
ncbi:MAG: hypothetical protein IPP93_11410 [Chitinophagaceae bacterium]|nr:hypothetical protein [Chitinophagaceae bacterium]